MMDDDLIISDDDDDDDDARCETRVQVQGFLVCKARKLDD